jgi:hypothetical protein
MFQTLKLIPAKIWFIDGDLLGVLGFGLAGVVWVLLPFVEGCKWRLARVFVTGFGVFALAYIATMTMYGYVAK